MHNYISWSYKSIEEWHCFNYEEMYLRTDWDVLSKYLCSENVIIIDKVDGYKHEKIFKKKGVNSYQIISDTKEFKCSIIPKTELEKLLDVYQICILDCPEIQSREQLQKLKNIDPYYLNENAKEVISILNNIGCNLIYFFEDGIQVSMIVNDPLVGVKLFKNKFDDHNVISVSIIDLPDDNSIFELLKLGKLGKLGEKFVSIEDTGISIENNNLKITIWEYVDKNISQALDVLFDEDGIRYNDWEKRNTPEHLRDTELATFLSVIFTIVCVGIPIGIIYGLYKLLVYLISLI